MRNVIAAIITSVVLHGASALPVQAEGLPDASAQYLSWLEDRMRLWPAELHQIERSPVASADEVAKLKALMEQAHNEARSLSEGGQLSRSPVQLQVLTIETELERLAGEMDRLPVMAGPVPR